MFYIYNLTVSMTENVKGQELFEVIQKFYKSVIKNHSRRFKLTNKFTQFSESFTHPKKNQSPKSALLRPKKKEEPINEFQSLRYSNTRQSNVGKSSKDLRSTSKMDERSNSSKKTDKKYLGCSWIYSHSNIKKVFLYTMISSYIINEDIILFKTLERKINDFLEDNNVFNQLMIRNITQEWQKIGQLMLKNKAIRWQKILQAIINKLPDKFIDLIHQVTFNSFICSDYLNEKLISFFSKEIRININVFTINYLEIQEIVTSKPIYSKTIILGFLKHANEYVISNKLPEYTEEEKAQREAKKLIARNVTEILNEFEIDDDEMDYESLEMEDERKEKRVKDFICEKLQAYEKMNQDE